MPQALLAAPIILAVVLGAGGVLKLRDDDAATALEWDAMGVPAALNRRWARRAHPWGEMVLAVGLVLLGGPLGMVWAVAALVLTLAYLVLVTRAVAGGGASCNCFGADHASALTGWTVVRNAVLVLLAALSVGRLVTCESPLGVFREDPPTMGWSLAVVAAMAVTVLVAAPPAGSADGGPTAVPGSAQAPTSEEDQVPAAGAAASGAAAPAGAPAPEEVFVRAEAEQPEDDALEYLRTLTPQATLRDAEDAVVDLISASRRQAHLLVFLSPGCGPCSEVASLMPGWVEAMPQLAVRAVVTMTPEQLDDRSPNWKEWTLYDPDGMAGRMLQCTATPTAVLLGTDGMLAGGPERGAQGVIGFVEDIKAQLGVD